MCDADFHNFDMSGGTMPGGTMPARTYRPQHPGHFERKLMR